MVCDLTIWDSASKTKMKVQCDEDTASKVIVEEHAGKGAGQYTDLSGKPFSADWTKCRLVAFARRA